ncbi:MAG: glycosyltransferase family 39 protein, partial [Caulobacterales bacterium]
MLLTLFRLMALIASPLELGPDEAQYWRWSTSLDWGYFSKPPLIAWAIAATTQVFGDFEWAVRLSAPIVHAVCALFVARTAKDLAGKYAGAPAALLYLTAPGVALSSFIMSTDALLLAAAAIALAATIRLRRRPSLISFITLGLAIGVGLLAKYAMIYTIMGIAIAMLFDKSLRQNLLQPRLALSVLIAAALIGPNLYWNATHSFATFHHTAANANWGAAKFDVHEVGEFLAAQFGVFGPLAFALLPVALLTSGPKHKADQAGDDTSAIST